MRLNDIASLNQDFRALRLLAGDLSGASDFRHFFLCHRNAPNCQPGDCVIAMDIQLPQDEESLTLLLLNGAIASAAGLIIRAAEDYELPSSFLAAQMPFPILALPLHADLDVIVYGLQAGLQGELCYCDYIYSSFQKELSQLLECDPGCVALLSLLTYYVRTPVFLFSDQHILPQRCAENSYGEYAKRLWQTNVGHSFSLEQHELDGVTYCFFPITDSSTVIASLCLVYPDGFRLTQADRLLIFALLPHLSLCILRSIETERYYYKDITRFLTAILDGNYGADSKFLEQNAEYLAIDCAQQRLLWCVELLPLQDPSSGVYTRRISDYFSTLHRRFFFLETAEHLVYIVECDSPQAVLSEFRCSVLPQLARLAGNTGGMELHVGVSAEFSDLRELPRALSEAEFSLKIGKKMDPDQMFYGYDEYILYHLLDNIKHAPGIFSIHSEIILKLYDYDQQNNTELLSTFLSLCKCSFNALQAADEMYLHRNSLYKRMERISSVLDMDFDSVDNLIIFHLASKLYDLFN